MILPMRFYYSKHIKRRMRQRDLCKEDIEQTVAEPDRSDTAFKGRLLARKYIYGRILEVVYSQREEDYFLITAYWLKE